MPENNFAEINYANTLFLYGPVHYVLNLDTFIVKFV